MGSSDTFSLRRTLEVESGCDRVLCDSNCIDPLEECREIIGVMVRHEAKAVIACVRRMLANMVVKE